MSDMSQFTGGGAKKWVSGTTYAEGIVVWSPTDYQYSMRKSTGAGTTDPASDTTNWMPTGNRAIKSIQRGTTAGASPATATISAVDPAKSEVRWLGAQASDGVGSSLTRISLTSSTTLVITHSAVSQTTSWEVTERY